MTKLESLLTLLVLNQESAEGDGLDILCGVIKCRHVNCNDCPLDTPENMKELINELEAKNG